MKRIFKKYGFLKYAILIAGLDLLTRNEFEIGGGTVILIAAVLAVAFMEINEKLEEKEKKEIRKECQKTVDRKKATA